MAYFAEIDSITKIVQRVIVADQEFIDSGAVGDPANWVSCDKTKGGNSNKLAQIGGEYQSNAGRFISKKPYPSWILNDTTGHWEAPKAKPEDGNLKKWSEPKVDWEDVVIDGVIEKLK